MTALTVVVAILFVFTGSAKLIGVSQSLEVRDQLSISANGWRAIGTLEVAGAVGTMVGLAWKPIGVAALTGLALLMVGAFVSRVRIRDSVLWIAADVATFALVVVTLVLTIGS
ncbi:MAG: hypothetical protein JWQ70_1186 [Aeromicrobium sp.]|nr:hypothetical protein [Aeromicrobium sp.]